MAKCALFFSVTNTTRTFGHLSCTDVEHFLNKRRESLCACVNRWNISNFCAGVLQIPKQLKIGTFEGEFVIGVQLKRHSFGQWESDGSMLPRSCLVHTADSCENEGQFNCDRVIIWMCFLRPLVLNNIQRSSEKTNFRLSVSQSSAEALVRWGEKINYRLTAYFLSNISAKNYQNRLMYVEVIASQSSVIFQIQCRPILWWKWITNSNNVHVNKLTSWYLTHNNYAAG